MRILLLDNYDSFTYNLYDYILQTGAECTVLRNDVCHPDQMDPDGFDALVLSPGPKRPADAGYLIDYIQAFCRDKPMLGICLGHQALGEYFGARLVRSPEPVHGKTSRVRHDGSPLFEGIPEAFRVMRYHSLELASLESTPLACLAATSDGTIMALKHRHLPLYGVQFHPESILSEHGLTLLRNWVRLTSPTR